MSVGSRDPKVLAHQGAWLAAGGGLAVGLACCLPWRFMAQLSDVSAYSLLQALAYDWFVPVLACAGFAAAIAGIAAGRAERFARPRVITFQLVFVCFVLLTTLFQVHAHHEASIDWRLFFLVLGELLFLAAAVAFGKAAQQRFMFDNLMTHIFLLIFTLLTLYPVLWVIKIALGPNQGLTISLKLLPDHPNLDNFRYVLFEKPFFSWLLNSIFVAVATTLLGIFLATTAAYAFSRFRFPGRRSGLMSFLITQMFPGTMMMIPLYLIVNYLGLLDKLLGLVVVYSTSSIPFCVWMLKGYFDTIPKELEEAALIDGASRTMIFYRIILPLAKPAIAVTALFSFMTSWNEFILAATFMSKETSYTLPVGLRNFVGQFAQDWGYFSAGAILVSAPIVILFFLLQPYLVSGLTAGGVKG